MSYDDFRSIDELVRQLKLSFRSQPYEATMTPQELKQTISEGLLSFPLTDFDEQGDFRADTYAERLEWLAPYGATALFAAGGTGEFFSLTHEDFSAVIKTAVD